MASTASPGDPVRWRQAAARAAGAIAILAMAAAAAAALLLPPAAAADASDPAGELTDARDPTAPAGPPRAAPGSSPRSPGAASSWLARALSQAISSGKDPVQPGLPAPARCGGGPAFTGKVNLNQASERELDLLPGIGPAKAKRIAAWRADHGPFRRIRDLRRVKGFGRKTVLKLTPYLTLEGPTTAAAGRAR